MIRNLDPDDDYQYDATNRPRGDSRWHKEQAARAKQCLSFAPKEYMAELCANCHGPRYAHGEHALRKKAS
jgi:hypothetical protein